MNSRMVEMPLLRPSGLRRARGKPSHRSSRSSEVALRFDFVAQNLTQGHSPSATQKWPEHRSARTMSEAHRAESNGGDAGIRTRVQRVRRRSVRLCFSQFSWPVGEKQRKGKSDDAVVRSSSRQSRSNLTDDVRSP